MVGVGLTDTVFIELPRREYIVYWWSLCFVSLKSTHHTISNCHLEGNTIFDQWWSVGSYSDINRSRPLLTNGLVTVEFGQYETYIHWDLYPSEIYISYIPTPFGSLYTQTWFGYHRCPPSLFVWSLIIISSLIAVAVDLFNWAASVLVVLVSTATFSVDEVGSSISAASVVVLAAVANLYRSLAVKTRVSHLT